MTWALIKNCVYSKKLKVDWCEGRSINQVADHVSLDRLKLTVYTTP